jgi:hypothetical protein
MFIIVYRPHHMLHCETQYVGPYHTYAEAEEALVGFPALGPYTPDHNFNNPGVKFIATVREQYEPPDSW